MNDYNAEQIKKHVIELMINHSELFSVVEFSKFYYKEKNKDFTEYFLSNYVGLDYLIMHKLSAHNEFFHNNTWGEQSKLIVKSILWEYTSKKFLDKQELEQFENLFNGK